MLLLRTLLWYLGDQKHDCHWEVGQRIKYKINVCASLMLVLYQMWPWCVCVCFDYMVTCMSCVCVTRMVTSGFLNMQFHDWVWLGALQEHVWVYFLTMPLLSTVSHLLKVCVCVCVHVWLHVNLVNVFYFVCVSHGNDSPFRYCLYPSLEKWRAALTTDQPWSPPHKIIGNMSWPRPQFHGQ